MGSQSSKDGPIETESASLSVPVPIRDSDLFKHRASPHIVNFLSDNPELDVSIRQLATVTPVSERATREAVNALEDNNLISTFHEGNARRVHVNRERLFKPSDPIQSIPQVSFRTPVRVARDYVKDELEAVRGIVLFGSVARGEADRQSDIDLWILVEADQMEQRNTATKLAASLSELPIPETMPLSAVREGDFETFWPEFRSKLESGDWNRSDTPRHEFEFVVETPRSILGQSDRVKPVALFGEGITIFSTEDLDTIKTKLLANE